MLKGIVLCAKENIGESTDKDTGEVFSWDKVNLWVSVKSENPREQRSLICGYGEPREYGLKNDFNDRVIPGDTGVSCWADLHMSEVELYFDDRNRLDCVKVVSLNGREAL